MKKGDLDVKLVRSQKLIENFHHIKGKEEWSVKIYYDRKALCKQIDELSEEAAGLEKQIMARASSQSKKRMQM